MSDFFEKFVALTIVSLGTCVVTFGLAILWFRAVGREIDREVILLVAKICGGNVPWSDPALSCD
jgi:hypothetical protein